MGKVYNFQSVDGENRHGAKLVKRTLDAIFLKGLLQTREFRMCMDKGYDFPNIKELIEE